VKLANYAYQGTIRAGLVHDSKVFPIQKEDGSFFSSVDEILSAELDDWVRENQFRIVENEDGISIELVELKTPVLNPEKICCAAVNYLSHGNEQNVSPPTEPFFFGKFRNTLIGSGGDIQLPRISSKLDWEAELAVIIGRKGKNIPREKSLDFIVGYTVANDVSFRDLQRFGSSGNHFGPNWIKGKGLDTAFPLGPWLVTKDELRDPYACEISLTVNGDLKQKSKTGEMVFKIDRMIENLSADMTLQPGDVISTGTPQGVAQSTGGPYLKDGDLVEATISGIGTLRNRVRA
jgi:2-keto-4-pentenoate hydratase/2-oxohepta-3-ene-1,7-dioic acid hydratase in catechol pathway